MMTYVSDCVILTCLTMLHRLRAEPLPDEEAFEAIKAGVDAMPPGVKMMLNAGEHSTSARMVARLD